MDTFSIPSIQINYLYIAIAQHHAGRKLRRTTIRSLLALQLIKRVKEIFFESFPEEWELSVPAITLV